MNLINLMPYRHRRVEQRRRIFFAGLALTGLAATGCILLASMVLQRLQSQQVERNAVLEQARAGFEKQEAQVRQLQADIAVLQQRQETVGALQLQRNLPVALFNELSRLTPPGLALVSLRQDDLKVSISGVAATHERVSDLMAGIQHESAMLHQPELVELRAASPGPSVRVGAAPLPAPGAGLPNVDSLAGRRVEFSLSATIRRESLQGEVPP